MKLKYVISFGIVCLLSLGSVFFSLQTEAQELNRDFRIETLSGDESILDELAISALIREGSNNFSKVTFTSTGAEIEPTIYDEHHGLGERELENRELYRGAPWASKLETDDFIITHNFDHSYIWRSNSDPETRIAVLNKQTGNVEVLNHVFDEIAPYMSVWSSSAFLVENNDNFYYVLITDENTFLVYSFDPEALTLTFQFENEFNANRDTWVNWFSTNEAVFAQMPNEDSDLYMINFETQQVEIVETDFNLPSWNFWFSENQIIFEVEEDFELQGIFKVANTETGEMTELESPSFAEKLTDFWPNWSHSVVGNYFVLNYNVSEMSPQTQFIAIYDLDTLELVYEGSISLRRDQGLLEFWGTIQGFSVSSRD